MSESKTDPELAVQKLIRCTIKRAWTESIACVMVLIAFAWILQSSQTGSPRYYGCLLILVGTGFIAGVIWSFTLGYKLIEAHPVSDLGFWRAAFQTQANIQLVCFSTNPMTRSRCTATNRQRLDIPRND